MKMLLLKPTGQRADGSKKRIPIVRERGRKFGPITSEKSLRTTADIMFIGGNASGKTRWLNKLYSGASEIWTDTPAMMIRAVEPLQRWYEDPRVEKWVASRNRDWRSLRQFERVDALIEWAREVRPVILLDDAHLLSGRKLDLALRLAREAGRVVTGTTDEGRIPITLRMCLDARLPQRVPLKTEAAYDITSVVLWLAILISIGAGAWQLAMILGGMKVLAGGNRAAKQA